MKWWILGYLGSSPERSFLTPNITYLTGLAREAQKRETGSIESEGDLKGGYGGSRAGSWYSGFRVHLNSRVLTFCLNVTLLRKFHRTRVLRCA